MRLDPKPRIPTDPAAMALAVADLFQRANSAINALTEGQASAMYAARTAAPTTGTWARGDYVVNSAPSELGSASSKYVIHGWKRLTSGSTNTYGTDWVDDRRLTGN